MKIKIGMAFLFFGISSLASLGFAQTGNLPHPQALGSWRSDGDTAAAQKTFQSYPDEKIDCQDPVLYPSHPQQDLKQYLVYEWADYDANQLVGGEQACTIPTSTGKFCVKGDSAYHVILSDVLQDACGHYYRGFKEIYFLAQDENMGTLFSPGRSMYPRPNSQFKGDFVSGGTFAVNPKDLVKISLPFPDDVAKSAELRQSALQTDFTFDEKTHLFIQKTQ